MRNDTKEFDVILTATAVRDPNGDAIGIVGVAQDIIERKRMEEVLREIEERYRVVTETATCALIMIDEESKILFINRSAENMFGYAIAGMLGRQLTILVPKHQPPGHRDSLRQGGNAGKRSTGWTSIELAGLHKSGREIPLEISLGEFIKNGKHIFAGIVRDISERKRVEEAVRDSELKAKEVEALQRIDQLRKDLIATVSHELRNPLVSTKGYINTLLQPDVQWEPQLQREFLEVADQEADRLNRLVGDLLTMSQLEAGVLKLEQERICLGDPPGDLDTHLGPLVTRHRFQMNFPGDLPPVFIDKHRMIQVFSNLVSNAAKFSEPGTGISIESTRSDKRVVIRVSDEGRGISQDQLDRVFEPFYRGEGFPTSASSGSGLGLSICRRLIEAHGGEMWIESELGKGSTLFFSLPTVDVDRVVG